jgi:hypothetical protein
LKHYEKECSKIVNGYSDWLGIACNEKLPVGGFEFKKIPRNELPPSIPYRGHDDLDLKKSVSFL